MATKTLYVLVGNAGDGSYYTRYTFNKEWIDAQDERDDLDYEYDLGVDGDGFHWTELQVPVECTPESMGFTDCATDDEE